VFKVSDLLKGSETLFGLDTTKEVGEWILALREAKVNKMGLGYWVKAPGDDDAPLPEPLVRRKQELDAGNGIFRQWLADGCVKTVSVVSKPSLAQMASILKSTAIPIKFDMPIRSDTSLYIREGEFGKICCCCYCLLLILFLLKIVLFFAFPKVALM
jgi:hypothetical protein